MRRVCGMQISSDGCRLLRVRWSNWVVIPVMLRNPVEEVWQMFAWKISLFKCSPLDGAAKTIDFYENRSPSSKTKQVLHFSISLSLLLPGVVIPLIHSIPLVGRLRGSRLRAPSCSWRRRRQQKKNSNQLLPRNTSYLTTDWAFERNGCVVWLNFFVCHSKRWVKLRVWLLNF